MGAVSEVSIVSSSSDGKYSGNSSSSLSLSITTGAGLVLEERLVLGLEILSFAAETVAAGSWSCTDTWSKSMARVDLGGLDVKLIGYA